MTEFAACLAELINSQLECREPNMDPNPEMISNIKRVAYKHHMNRMLLNPLIQLGLDSSGELFSYVTRQIYVSSTQLNEVKRITEKFEEQQILNQMLKGSRLKMLYKKPEFREMSDIDLLVREEDFSRADAALKELGYSFTGKEEHHDIYKKHFVMIELHRSLYTEKIDKKQYDYFATYERTRKVNGYEYALEFSPEDFYVYMVAHMARHFYARGCGIRNLVDIYVFKEYYKEKLDFKYINKELSEIGLLKFEGYMSELAYGWLRRETVSSFLNSLFEYMLDCGIYGRDENGIWQKYMKYKKISDDQSVKSLRRVYMFPPVEVIEGDYPWVGRHHFLLPVAWVVRGVKSIMDIGSRKRLGYISKNGSDKASEIQKIYQNLDLNFEKRV